MFGLFGGPKYELGKGTVIAISGCKDEQTSGDAARIAKYFELPPGVGMDGAGGACTNGLMRIVFAKDKTMAQFDGTWGDLMVQLRKSLKQATNDAGKEVFSQIPQLTASYDLPLTENFELLNRAAPALQALDRDGVTHVRSCVEQQAIFALEEKSSTHTRL